QPLFADGVVRAARAVPLGDRIRDRLHRDVLGLLCPELLGLPLAGTPWHGEPRTATTVLTAPPAGGCRRRLAAGVWRRRGRVPARLRPGPRRGEPVVRHRPPQRRRTPAP